MSEQKKDEDRDGPLRAIGEFTGKVAGVAIGRPVEALGEYTNIDLVAEIGRGVQKASHKAGDTLGQFAQGTWDAASGIFYQDDEKKEKGLQDIGASVTQTAQGIYHSAVYIAKNGKDAFDGMMESDASKIKNAARSVGKVVAVGALAIGAVDLADGFDGAIAEAEEPLVEEMGEEDSHADGSKDVVHVETRNEEMEGSVHPESGVPYHSHEVELPDDTVVEGVFPDFDEEYATSIPESLYLSTDYEQFSYANQQLALSVSDDPQLASEFTAEQIDQIRHGETPDGYVWHHHEEPGRMELVKEDVHAQSGHTGGRSLWGGGAEYR